MGNLIRFIFTVLLSVFASTLACAKEKIELYDLTDAEFNSLPPKVKYLHEKSGGMVHRAVFTMADGLRLHTLILGTPGQSENTGILSFGGTFTKGVYLKRPAIKVGMAQLGYDPSQITLDQVAFEMSRKGDLFIVLTEPRAFGAGSFKYEAAGDHHVFGLFDMASDYRSMAIFTSELAGGQKIITMGHSLGGLIADAADLGFALDKNAQLYYSPSKQMALKNYVKLKILLGTPFLLTQYSVPSRAQFSLNTLAPIATTHSEKLANLYQGAKERVPFYDELVHGSLIAIQGLAKINPLLARLHSADMVDFRHLYTSDIETLAKHSVADTYPEKLLRQYTKMYKDLDLNITLRNGKTLSVRQAYKDIPPEARIPSLMATGFHDHIASWKQVKDHVDYFLAQGVPAAMLNLHGGHLNSSMGPQMTEVALAARNFLKTHETSMKLDEINRLINQIDCKKSAN